MMNSNSFSLPVVLLAAGLSLSSTLAQPVLGNAANTFITPTSAIYQTTSSNHIATEYEFDIRSEDLRLDAIQLFGEQTSFSDEEKATYWSAIRAKSENTAINIFDLF